MNRQTSNGLPARKKSAIWKEFYENSTLHGLRNVFESDYAGFRVMWLVLVLSASAWLLYSSVQSFQRYLESPTLMHVFEEMKYPLPFPSVTICPDNFADRYKIYAQDNDTVFKQYGLNISACSVTADVRGGRPCGHALVCAYIGGFVAYGAPIVNCTQEYQENITQALKSSNITFDMLEFIYKFSESWEEVLQYCMVGHYERITCTNIKYYKKTYKEHRLCHTFNDDEMNFVSTGPGSTGGIFFVLQNRIDRYFYPRFAEGFNLYIHEKGAGMGDNEIRVPPGRFTSIAINQVKLQHLEKGEGGKCERKSLRGHKIYTQSQCFEECRDMYIEKKCGCRLSSALSIDNTICFASQRQCVLDNSFNYSRLVTPGECDCPLACTLTKYRTSISYGVMPRKSAIGVSQMFPLIPHYSEKDHIIISVFFDSHRDVILEEKMSFGATSLFGEIGGNMGLLLGCSVITLVEFLFLFFSLLMSCFRAQRRQAVDAAS